MLAGALLAGLVALAPARAGTSCGCGGSVVQLSRGGAWVLLDRLSIDPKYDPGPAAPSSTRPAPPSGEDFRLARLDAGYSSAFEGALKVIDRWKPGSPTLARILEETIRRMGYSRTSSTFAELPEHLNVPDLTRKAHPGLKVRTVILYVPKYGSIISEPIWRQLDLETRIGLVIHEALRQLQGPYGYTDLDDKALQRLTGTLMYTDPGKTGTLERLPYLTPELLRLTDALRPLALAQARVDQYRHSVCETFGPSFSVPGSALAGTNCQDEEEEKENAALMQLRVSTGNSRTRFDLKHLEQLRGEACSAEGPSDAIAWGNELRNELLRCSLSLATLPSSSREKCRQEVTKLPEHELWLLGLDGFFDLIRSSVDRGQVRNGTRLRELEQLSRRSKTGASSDISESEYLEFWKQLVRQGVLNP